MGETHFVLGRNWMQHFAQKSAQQPGVLTVRKLRGWIDEPSPRGLPAQVENLVILSYAEQANLRFTLHGGPASPSIESLTDDLELHEISLPPPEMWALARQRAANIFGLALPELRSATNVSEAVKTLREHATARREAAAALAARLRDLLAPFGLTIEGSNRGRTAVAVHDLLVALERARPEDMVQVLARAPVATSESAMGSSLQKAADVLQRIDQTRWEILEAAFGLQDDRRAAAGALRAQLTEALGADEYAVALGARLLRVEAEAVRLLTVVPPPRRPPSEPGWAVVAEGNEQRLSPNDAAGKLARIQQTLEAHPSGRLSITWKVEEADRR
jgi:hypothetical protein